MEWSGRAPDVSAWPSRSLSGSVARQLTWASIDDDSPIPSRKRDKRKQIFELHHGASGEIGL